MAFTSTEKATILYYLGYPAKVVDINSLEYNSMVNSRFENYPVDGEPIVRDLLTQIAALKAALTKAQCTMGTKQVGDIHLNPDMVGSNLKKELKRLYTELSEMMNITRIGKALGSKNVRVSY